MSYCTDMYDGYTIRAAFYAPSKTHISLSSRISSTILYQSSYATLCHLDYRSLRLLTDNAMSGSYHLIDFKALLLMSKINFFQRLNALFKQQQFAAYKRSLLVQNLTSSARGAFCAFILLSMGCEADNGQNDQSSRCKLRPATRMSASRFYTMTYKPISGILEERKR